MTVWAPAEQADAADYRVPDGGNPLPAGAASPAAPVASAKASSTCDSPGQSAQPVLDDLADRLPAPTAAGTAVVAVSIRGLSGRHAGHGPGLRRW
jgi:hypothetical protein